MCAAPWNVSSPFSSVAARRLIVLPEAPGGEKNGLDDYLAAGHSVADLMALVVDSLAPLHDESERRSGPYLASKRGLFYLKPEGDYVVDIRLANFSARIVRHLKRDDGLETTQEHEIECYHGDETTTVSVLASKFTSMGWVAERLPPRYILCAGSTVRDRVREATQSLSDDDIPDSIVFTAPGWRKFGDRHGYVHGGGVIGVASMFVSSCPTI
jgi:hypothetical protein